MLHHPLIAGFVAWWAVVAVVVRLDQGSLTLALVSLASPSIAVYLAARLSRRAQRQIQAALDAQTAEAARVAAVADAAVREAQRSAEGAKVTADNVAKAARDAVKQAEDAAAGAKVTAEETHHLVNSQKDELERELGIRDRRIEILEEQIRVLTLDDEGGTST